MIVTVNMRRRPWQCLTKSKVDQPSLKVLGSGLVFHAVGHGWSGRRRVVMFHSSAKILVAAPREFYCLCRKKGVGVYITFSSLARPTKIILPDTAHQAQPRDRPSC